MIRILLIGPLPPPMGGNTRHFATLLAHLDSHEAFQVTLVNTSRGGGYLNPVRNLVVALRVLIQVVLNLHRVDIVSYHASNRGMLRFGPLIVGLSKLAKRRIMLRVFGGSFGDCYQQQGKLQMAITRRLLLTADVILLQTRRSVDQLRGPAVGHLEWYSTHVKACVRPFNEAADENDDQNSRCARFVFLGHVRRAKGLETILEAAPHLPDGCSIEIFGPLDEYTADDIRARGAGRIRYGGYLTHDEVDIRLWSYDCLVLPTLHPSEGYPGVIPEAYVHGLPVITTRWLAIPEIVDDSCGILVEPGDTQAFVGAIKVLYHDRARWLKLKKGALIRSKEFDYSYWARKFEKICEDLVRAR